jgi:pimeloyl-ACP methyl ester carboxylesterase
MDRLTAFARLRRRLHELVPGVTTVAYDRRGYASSVHLPADGPFSRQIDDLASVIAATSSAGRPIVVVGHSLGATIGLGYGARRPTDLVGLVAGEPPMSWMPWWPSTAGTSTIAVAREHGHRAAAESFMRRIVGDRVWERLPEATKDARRAEGEAIVSDLSSLRTGGAPFDLRSVRVPVIVLRGTRSAAHNRRGSEYAAALVPMATIRPLDGAGHAVHTERPDDLALAVCELLADPPRMRRNPPEPPTAGGDHG